MGKSSGDYIKNHFKRGIKAIKGCWNVLGFTDWRMLGDFFCATRTYLWSQCFLSFFPSSKRPAVVLEFLKYSTHVGHITSCEMRPQISGTYWQHVMRGDREGEEHLSRFLSVHLYCTAMTFEYWITIKFIKLLRLLSFISDEFNFSFAKGQMCFFFQKSFLSTAHACWHTIPGDRGLVSNIWRIRSHWLNIFPELTAHSHLRRCDLKPAFRKAICRVVSEFHNEISILLPSVILVLPQTYKAGLILALTQIQQGSIALLHDEVWTDGVQTQTFLIPLVTLKPLSVLSAAATAPVASCAAPLSDKGTSSLSSRRPGTRLSLR